MKKKILIIVIIILAIVLLFPIPLHLRDGGSVEYKALLYSITKYHQLDHNSETGYRDGIGIKILGMEVYNSTKDYTETTTVVEERTKLKDIKITNVEGISTTKLVKFNGILYGESYKMIDYAGDFSKTIGKIDYLIGEEYLPELNGETNCKKLLNASVLEANEKSMVLNVNNVAVLFEALDNENIKKSNGENLYNIDDNEYNSFVGTILEETTTYMIVEPNEDEEERKSSDKIRINYGTEHIDYLYGVGRKVIIQYTGYIMETYPAQINTNNILTNGYEEFEIAVKNSESIKKIKILNNTELYKNNSDFNLYYYGLDEVNVTVDNKTMPLEEALRTGKMTIDGIIVKANKDFPNVVSYDDGGSIEYHYEDYTIIKCHTLDGNRDVYIGVPEMTLKNAKYE